MKMSTKARYGLYACIKLAEKYGEDFVSTVDLANETGVSDGYLEQIIAMLKKGGIIISQRGANGGHKLADKPINISVGKVLRCVEDNLEIVDCINGTCESKCTCSSSHAPCSYFKVDGTATVSSCWAPGACVCWA